MAVQKNDGSALFILFLVVMIDMIGFGIIIPFLTYFIEDLATKEGIIEFGFWIGLMLLSYSAAQFLFSPFWGSLSDRIGRRPVIMAGLLGNTVFFTAFGLSSSLTMALIARFFAGAFNANIAVAKAYIGDISDHTNLAKRMGLIVHHLDWDSLSVHFWVENSRALHKSGTCFPIQFLIVIHICSLVLSHQHYRLHPLY